MIRARAQRLTPVALLVAAAALGCAASAEPSARTAEPAATSQAAATGSEDVQRARADRLVRIADQLGALSRDFFMSWSSHGPDWEHGGFHGTLDRAWQPIDPTSKGLIQQARHLWSTTLWFERREPTPRVRAIAEHVYSFIQANFRDRDGEYFFKVDADGTPLDRRKVLYAEAFAIYSLTAYGRVFHVPTATSDALTCFRSLDRRAHDAAHGGYDQRVDAPWLTPGAAKETNTHLHLLEAFTALFEATGDAQVRARVEELLRLFVDRIVQPAGYAAKDFTADFTPFGTPTQSYGHDLETAWLLLESARVLGRQSDPRVLDASRRLATTATAHGYDREHGGFFEEGPAGAHATKLEKIWWVQAEALPGLFALYRLSPSDEVLSELESTLEFIEGYQRDTPFGGWYWGVTPAGEIGPHGANKGEEWKASYHELRALVLTEDWIRSGTGPLSAP